MNQMIIQDQYPNDNVLNNSYVQITNNGWFVAEFYITYISNGKPIRQDSGAFYIGQTRRLYIDKGTTEVILKVEIWIFGGYVVLYNDYLDTTASNCFVLQGTIFNPSMIKITCPELGTNEPNYPDIPNNPCYCCTPCHYNLYCNCCYNCNNTNYCCNKFSYDSYPSSKCNSFKNI